jgi:enoyl-CoA hydratase/carnithine racemase
MPSIRYEKSGAVGQIILCDPPHNFFNVDFCDQLRDAVMSATADDLRAVLVRAGGAVAAWFRRGGDGSRSAAPAGGARSSRRAASPASARAGEPRSTYARRNCPVIAKDFIEVFSATFS